LDWHVPRSDAWSKADAMNILKKLALGAIGAIAVYKSGKPASARSVSGTTAKRAKTA
jgi:isoaspartyl peptidase/L-asparaginase-like protein (Ntn-hydrolase superfamily)